MKTSFFILLHTLLHAVCVDSFSQNIKDNEVEYRYIRLPSSPLDKSIKNYQASIEAPYEEKNRELWAEYEQKQKVYQEEYDKEKATYPERVKEAEARYEKEMEEYNKKGLGTKIVEKNVLGENNKPVKRIPPEPYLKQAEKPALKTSYDYPALSSTYLQLEGFDNKPENAITITVTLYGFDYTQPRVMTEQKSMTKVENGKSYSYQATYYHIEYSYRHPMAVKVIAPDGKEILNVTPSELNNYKVYKSSAVEKYPQVNNEVMVKSSEEKILQENLTKINEIVNEKYGFQRIKRKTELYYVKSKNDEYSDIMNAYNNISSGLMILGDEEEAGIPKIKTAVDIWKKALQESDPSNKKARIDKDVTIALCFNLLEACIALRDITLGYEIIQKLNAFDISSKERKRKDDYELVFNDIKKRLISNQ